MTSSRYLSDEDHDNLVAYLDGELDDQAARALEAKLNLDPNARAEADALMRTWELLDYLPRAEPSPSFTHRTLDQVAAVRPASTVAHIRAAWREWALAACWVAAVLMAAVGGYMGVSVFAERQPTVAAEPTEIDERLVRDLRVIENKRLYDHVDDLDFLMQLDVPDLFGNDS